MKLDHSETADDESFYGYEIAMEDENPGIIGILLVCPECESESRFENMKQIRRSEWLEMTPIGMLLTNGYDAHEAYCPEHAVLQFEEGHSDIASENHVPGLEPTALRY